MRQPGQLSCLSREGRMLCDSSWGSASTSTRLGNEEHTVAFPQALLSVKGYLNPWPVMSLLKPFIFIQQWPLLVSLQHWSLFPMVGPSPMVNPSVLPVRATSELSMHLIPFLWGQAAFGLCTAELRHQGSQPGKILEKTICMQLPAGYPKAFLTENKVSCLSQVCMSISLGHSLPFLWPTLTAPWLIYFCFKRIMECNFWYFLYLWEASISLVPSLSSTLFSDL